MHRALAPGSLAVHTLVSASRNSLGPSLYAPRADYLIALDHTSPRSDCTQGWQLICGRSRGSWDSPSCHEWLAKMPRPFRLFQTVWERGGRSRRGLMPTCGVPRSQRSPASATAAGALTVLMLAVRVVHEDPPSALGQAPRRAIDMRILDDVSVLQSWPGVKRKAPGDAGPWGRGARWSDLDGWHSHDGMGRYETRPAQLRVKSLRAKPAKSLKLRTLWRWYSYETLLQRLA
jgi:hypothetical protein